MSDNNLPNEDGLLRSTGTNDTVDKDYEELLAREEESLAEIRTVLPDFTPREFDHTMADFFLSNPFFGAISIEITKIFDIKQPTAYIGVRLNGRQHEIIMGINPKFFRGLVNKQRHGVLKHELYHLIFQHIFSRAVGDTQYALMHNWASDMAINSIIGKENLPNICIIPGVRPMAPAKVIDPATGKPMIDPKTKKPITNPNKLEPVQGPYADFIANAPVGQASDYYFEELRKIQDQQGDGDGSIAISSGIGTMDDHDQWKNLPADVQEQIKEKVRDMVANGVKRADRDNSWGDIPMEIQESIRRSVSREIDWRSIVRNFIGRTRSNDRTSTVRRINKKMPYLQPGVKRTLTSKFVVFIDQSGSVSDEDICLFFGELENLSSLTEIDVYHFDTEVDTKSKTVWKKGQPAPPAHRTRCGGTDFQCVIDYVNSKENRGIYSGVIIATDGYAGKPGQIIGAKTLWVITETGTTEAIPQGCLYAQMKKEKQFKKI